MKLLRWLVMALVCVAAALVVAGRWGWLAGSAPSDLGVKNGRLKPPSRTDNSVSSQAGLYPEHPQRVNAGIDPFPVQGSVPASLDRLAHLLAHTPGTVVVTRSSNYLYAQASTPVLRFTDDVEFWADPVAPTIHVRSASRLGNKDFGANRARIEALRARYLGA